MKKFLIVLTTLSLFLFALLPVSAKNVSNQQYSGEEIFKGIFFGQGEVAEQLATSFTKDQLALNNGKEAKKETDKIVKEMKKLDKHYFKDLKKAVYNEDYLLTKELLNKGGELFYKVVNGQEQQQASKVGEVTTSASGVAILFLAITTVAVYSHAGIVTFYAYAAALRWGPGLSSEESDTNQEIVVDDVISSLN
jgi:SdpC family antimicrobial peptide